MVMAVRLGIDEGCSELALDRDRHLARRLFVFDQQSHQFRADAQVIDGAEIMPAQTPLPVEDQHRRRALQLIGAHRLGQVLAVRLVERDRNGDVVFREIGFDFFGRLLSEFLKRHVQAEDSDFLFVERTTEPHRLRQAVFLRAGTGQLPDSDDDDFALLGFE